MIRKNILFIYERLFSTRGEKNTKLSQRTFMFGGGIAVACALLLALAVWPQAQGATGTSPKHNSAAAVEVSISVVFDIGRPRTRDPITGNCSGFGLCRVTLSGTVSAARAITGLVALREDGKLELTFQGKLPESGSTLFIDDDFPLSSEIARKLGLRSATIVSGQYSLSAGKVLVNARLVK